MFCCCHALAVVSLLRLLRIVAVDVAADLVMQGLRLRLLLLLVLLVVVLMVLLLLCCYCFAFAAC